MTTAVLIALLVIAVTVIILGASFFVMRRSRDEVQGVSRRSNAPSVDDVRLETRGDEQIDLGSFRGRAALLVTLPTSNPDAEEMEKLSILQRRYRADRFTVLGVPLGNGHGTGDPAPEAGQVPVVASIDPGDHALLDRVQGALGPATDVYTKILVDPEGRVVCRFAPQTDPRSAEVTRRVEELIAA